MRVLSVFDHLWLPTPRGGEFPADSAWGPQQVADDFIAALQARGVTVAALVALAPDAPDEALKPGTGGVSAEYAAHERLGYPVFGRRRPTESIAEVAALFRPTVVIFQHGHRFAIARACLAVGLPTVIYHQDVALHQLSQHGGRAAELDLAHPLLAQIASTYFTAGRYERVFGRAIEVIPPFVRPELYRSATTRRKIIFVDPVPANGLDLALALAAARPYIVFAFVADRPIAAEEHYWLVEETRKLPNVLLQPRPLGGMREAYREAKLLLAPSRQEEEWPRAVVEAQASGIPVLGSMLGGLPETVGRGGILLDPHADIAAWTQALSRIWDEEAEYAALSAAAREHSERLAIQPDAVLDRLLELLDRHAAAAARPASSRPAPQPPSRSTNAGRRGIGLSVVIPTHGRPDNLDRLLNSMRKQLTVPPDRQCIVANDGAHDERYAAVIERHRDYVEYVVLPENHGPAAARNAGAARARHEFLVFVDDDCVVSPYWLDWLSAVLVENPDLDMVGGTTRPLTTELPGLLEPLLIDCGYYPMPILYGDEVMILVSACLAVRRSRFEMIGGFDQSVRVGEDRNLTFRLKRARAISYVDPSWYVYHDMTATLGRHLRRYFAYGYWLAVELEVERTSPDRQLWPIDDHSWGSWLRRIKESIAYIRSRPGYAARPIAGRAAMQIFALLTRLTMDIGVIKGKAAADKGIGVTMPRAG